MLKYLVLSIFILIFSFLIKKDRVYLIPMLLIVFSNINGLLDWEDFALKGVIKFPDYGLVLTILILFFDRFTINRDTPEYSLAVKHSSLYKMIQVYWFYYLVLFLFSVVIQGGLEWPIKMGRVFFYGWIFFLVYQQLLRDPIGKFTKIINCLMIATLVFAGLYIAYNLFGWSIYPKGDQEIFSLVHLGDIKRNFSGFPTFTYYFILLFTHRLINDENGKFWNLGGLLILLLCVLLMLTRGAAVLIVLLMLFMILYRRQTAVGMTRISILVVALLIAVPLIMIFAEGHYQAMSNRFNEFSTTGVGGSSNVLVRTREFSKIIKNLVDFNPVMGFGFTNVWMLGFRSNVYHGGSADNGFSNLLGTTGFLGLLIFMLLIFFWLRTNLKLQALRAEPFSKVNFVFIIFMMGSLMNGAGMSYMHTFALFMAYDLLAYAYLKNDKNLASSALNQHASSAALKSPLIPIL
jgi:hypothetical protein